MLLNEDGTGTEVGPGPTDRRTSAPLSWDLAGEVLQVNTTRGPVRYGVAHAEPEQLVLNPAVAPHEGTTP